MSNSFIVDCFAGTSLDEGGQAVRPIAAGWSAGGGAIYNSLSAYLALRWVSILSCFAGSGGGIFSLSRVQLYGVTIDDCHAINGGAIFAFGNLELTFSRLSRCTASSLGGGLISYSSTDLENVIIESCAATSGAGGGIELYNYATLDMVEVTMRNNTALTRGAAINLGTGARLHSLVLYLDHWCRGTNGDTVSIINGFLNDPVTGASTSLVFFDLHLNTFDCEGAWAQSNVSSTGAARRQLQIAAPQPLVDVNHNLCSDLTYTSLQGTTLPVCGTHAVCSDRPIVDGSPVTTPHCSCAPGSYPRPETPGGVALLSATQLVTRPFDAGCVTPRRGEDVSVYTEQLVVQLRKRENEPPQLLSKLTLRVIGTDGVAASWRVSTPTVSWLRPDLTPALNGVVPPSTSLVEVSIPLGFSASGLRESTDPYTTTLYTDVQAVEYTTFQTQTLLYVSADTVASRSSWGLPTEGRCVSLEAQRENQVREASWLKLRIGSRTGLDFQACDLDGLVVQHKLPSEYDSRRFEVIPTLVDSPFQEHPFATLSSEVATVAYVGGGAYNVRFHFSTPGNYSLNLTLGSELVGLPLRLIVECPLREAPILSGSTCGCAPGLELLGAGQCELCPEGKAKSLAANTACGLCHPGFYADHLGQVECTPCELGRFADAAGRTACTACAAGTSTSGLAGQDSCSACGPGTYSLGNEGACSLCPAGTFNGEFGQAGCAACYVSKYAGPGQAECDECGLRDDAQQTADNTGIPEAENGIDCTDGLVVGTLPEYWSSRDLFYNNTNQTRTWACLVEGVCLGGLNNNCAEGHTGIACIKCIDGWYTTKYGEEPCVPIPGWKPSQSNVVLYAIYIVGFFLVCGASFVATAICFRLSRNEAEDDVTPPWQEDGMDEYALLLQTSGGQEGLQPEKSTSPKKSKSRKGLAAFAQSTEDLQSNSTRQFLTAPKETLDEPSAGPAHVWIMREVDGPHARSRVQTPVAQAQLTKAPHPKKLKTLREANFTADAAEAFEHVEAPGADSIDGSVVPAIAEHASVTVGHSSSMPVCNTLATTLRKYSMQVEVEPDDEEVSAPFLAACCDIGGDALTPTRPAVATPISLLMSSPLWCIAGG